MRSKTIISILTFAVAFSFSAYFASFFLPEKVEESFYSYSNNSIQTDSEILSFLRQDIQNGVERGSANCRHKNSEQSNSFQSYVVRKAKAVKVYSDKSSNMNATQLPADFRVAWRKHMKAWRDYSNFLDKSAKSTNLDSQDFRTTADDFIDEINLTWQDVLDIGESYDENVRLEIQ